MNSGTYLLRSIFPIRSGADCDPFLRTGRYMVSEAPNCPSSNENSIRDPNVPVEPVKIMFIERGLREGIRCH